VITKADLAAVEPVRQRLLNLNSRASIFESTGGSAALAAFAPGDPLQSRSIPVQEHHDHRHEDHIRAHCVVLDAPVSWSGVTAWCRIVADALGERLLRCKGLVEIADTGEIVFLQGVQRVFHTPERLPRWPDADQRSRLVCITRDVERAELERTLPALKLPAGADPNATLAELAS
jgi:G3E family GTPase